MSFVLNKAKMASIDNDEILEIIQEKEEKFEKMFDRIDKDQNGFLKPNQLRKFWKRKDFDMDLFKKVKHAFNFNKHKEISLDGKLLNFFFFKLRKKFSLANFG